MRNFEERKEEIFRRSKDRLHKARTVRRTVAAVCIPAVLIIGALSLGFHSGNTVTAESDLLLDSVIVSGTPTAKTIEDDDTVNQISRIIVEILAANGAESESISNDCATSTTAQSVTAIYTITVTDKEGVIRKFTLTDNGLTDEAGISYPMTDQQQTQIRALLGLS